MNINCVLFAARHLKAEEIQNKRILEAGSYDVNGSLKPLITHYHPSEYTGVDIIAGPGVDIICDVHELIARFGVNSFDMVVATELLEHVRNWQSAIHNIKTICRPKGIILITTRSYGFHYHDYPSDYWRFELADMNHIFQDCLIQQIEKDTSSPGVFLKASKPEPFSEANLSCYELYSIMTNKKQNELTEKEIKSLSAKKIMLKAKIRSILIRMLNHL